MKLVVLITKLGEGYFFQIKDGEKYLEGHISDKLPKVLITNYEKKYKTECELLRDTKEYNNIWFETFSEEDFSSFIKKNVDIKKMVKQ